MEKEQKVYSLETIKAFCRGITQKVIADESGLSEYTVSGTFGENPNPKHETLRKLSFFCDAFLEEKKNILRVSKQ